VASGRIEQRLAALTLYARRVTPLPAASPWRINLHVALPSAEFGDLAALETSYLVDTGKVAQLQIGIDRRADLPQPSGER
jgi:hypothetical protein